MQDINYEALRWAEKRPGLSVGPKVILMKLAATADAKGICAPVFLEDLATDLCMSTRTLKKYLQQIYEDGLIIWREPSNPRDRTTPHEFELVGYDSK